jgi:hypothetical protein
MNPNEQPPAADKVQEMLVNVILDRSGSMQSSQKRTIDGYNEFVNGLKADAATKYKISLTQFDSPADGPELTVTYLEKPLAEVPVLTMESYQPRGSTPLYDAVGECVRRVPNSSGVGVMTVIITDGMENASREFSQASVRDLIKQKESDGWKFVFLGANIDSAAVGGSLGVAAPDCANYAIGNEASLYSTVASSAMRFASASRTHGSLSMQARASSNFTAQERSAMGGRPTAPPPFRPKNPVPATPQRTAQTKRSKTEWSVRGEVPSA